MAESNYQIAASIIKEPKTFIITAGAVMGVDSGLPDFRGEHATVIRINPCEAKIASPHVSLLSEALPALQHINELL